MAPAAREHRHLRAALREHLRRHQRDAIHAQDDDAIAVRRVVGAVARPDRHALGRRAGHGIDGRRGARRCNVRPSNTEPLLRLNLEANDETTFEAAKRKVLPLLGTPV